MDSVRGKAGFTHGMGGEDQVVREMAGFTHGRGLLQDGVALAAVAFPDDFPL